MTDDTPPDPLPRWRRQSVAEGGGMVADPQGQWVHVEHFGLQSWVLDALDDEPLDTRPGGDEALRAAVTAYRDLRTERRWLAVEAALAAPVSRLPDATLSDSAGRDDAESARPSGDEAPEVERLARAHEDIVTMYANHRPGWDAVYEWHTDPGDLFKARAAIAAILARADEYEAAEQRDAAPVSPSPDRRTCDICGNVIVNEARGGIPPSAGDHDPAPHVAKAYAALSSDTKET